MYTSFYPQVPNKFILLEKNRYNGKINENLHYLYGRIEKGLGFQSKVNIFITDSATFGLLDLEKVINISIYSFELVDF